MKANEKRAEALSWGCESVYCATTEKQIATALDAAERRGEERVLRLAIKAVRDRANRIRVLAATKAVDDLHAERVRGIASWIDGDAGTIRHAVQTYRKARRARARGKR